MDNIFMLLAQEDVLKAGEHTLSLLERIQAGGVPLICLVLAVVLGLAFYWQMRRNNGLEKEWREAQKVDGDKSLGQADKSLTQQKELMREMLQRDRDALEAHNAMAMALTGVTDTIKDLAVTQNAGVTAQRDIAARTSGVETRVTSIDNRLVDMERRLRDALDDRRAPPRT